MTDLHLPSGVITLPRARLEEAVAVLAHAFARDPLMRYVFDDQGDAYEEALRALFRFSCAVRFELNWPLVGVERAGRLVGVMGVTEPEDRAWPPALSAAYAQFQAVVGPCAAARFERYAALADPHRPRQPNYLVGVIGVHPEAQGRGVGRRLLAAIQALSAAHPASIGVYLDTENPASKAFYEHCGYRVIGQERLDDAIDIWCLFRPDAAQTPQHGSPR